MQNVFIPAGYNQVMPYLIIRDAAGFSAFMQKVFGATEIMKHMRDEHIIMHGELKIGDCVIMFADATDQYPPLPASMFIYVNDADATYEKALAEGAVSISPMGNQSYGRSGGIQDPHGNKWWITTAPKE